MGFIDASRKLFDAIDSRDAQTYKLLQKDIGRNKAFVLMNLFRGLVLGPILGTAAGVMILPIKKCIEYRTTEIYSPIIQRIEATFPEEKGRVFSAPPKANWLKIEFERSDSSGGNKASYSCTAYRQEDPKGGIVLTCEVRNNVFATVGGKK